MPCLTTIALIFCALSLCKNTETHENFVWPTSNELMLQNGKQEYHSLLERKQSNYGQCWADTVEKLERSCAHLDEYRQYWLAITFTYCFAKTSNNLNLFDETCLQIVQSKENTFDDQLVPQLQQCTKSIDIKLFQTFSLFFVHSQSICFYLQSQQWQRKTENLVNNLVSNAHLVSHSLDSAVDKIHELKQIQNSSLKHQLDLNEDLKVAKTSLEQFRMQTKEQQDLIEKILYQFSSLKELILVELTTNSSIVYYFLNMLTVHFVTTAQRVIGVRIHLYILLLFGFFLEKKMVAYLINLHIINDLTISLDMQNIWLIRSVIMFVMIFIYLWALVTYKDIGKLNYKILKENSVILNDIYNQLNSSKTKSKFNL